MGKLAQSLMKFYRQYLAKYFFFRFTRALITYLFFYVRMMYYALVKKRRIYAAELISVRDFNKTLSLTPIEVDASNDYLVPAPRFFNTHLVDITFSRGNDIMLASPRLEISYLPHTVALAGSYLILSKGYAIHPNSFNPITDYSPLETFGVGRIYHKRKRILLLLNEPMIEIRSAINLLGQNAGNYAHWLTEILPKLAIANLNESLDDQPLLVDGWIHPNFHESINWLNEKWNRKVLYVNRWQAVKADTLIDISLPGYEPYIPQELFKKSRSIYINSFSSYALNLLREQCHSLAKSENLKTGSKRVYLKRAIKSSNIRRVYNTEELEAVLAENGFQFIESETLSFKEQVAACLNAEIIVGAVGAALANIIFAPPRCRVLALAPYYSDGNYYYYSNLAAALGHDLMYVLGKPLNKGNHPMHQDYFIDKSELASSIKRALFGQ